MKRKKRRQDGRKRGSEKSGKEHGGSRKILQRKYTVCGDDLTYC